MARPGPSSPRAFYTAPAEQVHGITNYVPLFQNHGIGHWRKAEDFVDLHSVSGRGAFDFATRPTTRAQPGNSPPPSCSLTRLPTCGFQPGCTRISGSIYWIRVRRRACGRRLPPAGGNTLPDLGISPVIHRSPAQIRGSDRFQLS
jgi:hypothetical protein